LRGTFAVIVAVTIAGCGVDLPAPAPDEVVPSYGYNGAETIIEIYGKHFYPQVEVDASGRGAPDVDAGFEVTLVREDIGEAVALSGVDLADYNRIRAIVPMDLDPGTWDLVVTSPTGSEGRQASAFEVTDTMADRLRISAEGGPDFEAGEPAPITIELLDPEGEKVLDLVEIEVELLPHDPPEEPDVFAYEFDEDSLDGQSPLEDGRHGIRGWLEYGEATFDLVVSRPNVVTVAARPVYDRSPIADAEQDIKWSAGPPYGVEIVRVGYEEDEILEAEAGEDIDLRLRVFDERNNTVDRPEDKVYLRSDCEGVSFYSDEIQIDGETDVTVQIRQANPADCLDNRIVSVTYPGESGPIRISPGPLHHFDVRMAEGLVVPAGGTLTAEITPEDVYGNARSYSGAPPTIEDTLGGVESATWELGAESYFSRVVPVLAGESLRLEVVGDDGIRGESDDTFDVVAGNPTTIEVNVALPEVKAGVPAAVTVTTTDAWGNVVTAAAVPPSSYLFAASSGPVSCSYVGEGLDGSAEFECIFTVASPTVSASVSLPTWGLLATSAGFKVLNGDLASVEVTPGAYTVGAGTMLEVTFRGFDAWGNAFEEKSNPTLQISDTSGTIGPTSINLGGSGAVTGYFSFTKAGPTSIVAKQGTTEYGRSSAVTVTAGAPTELWLAPDEPWIWVGEPATVEVMAVDAFENPADLDAIATVRALSGDAADALVTLVDGRGTTTLTWTDAVVDDVLQAGTSALAGYSDAFAVVEDCGASGPTADLSFGGSDEVVACYTAGSGASLAADMSGSSSSAVDFRLAVGDAALVTGPSPTFSATATETGRIDVRGLVIDGNGCGSEVESTAWVGPDDGSAVGPLTLTPVDASIQVGVGATTIDVTGATTCTGDPASGATVRVWSDRGEITGATASGSALRVTLDATGSGSFTLDAAGAVAGGTATVQAGVGEGQAWGSTEVLFTDDGKRPTVWEQSPRGDTAGNVSQIVLTFSEALRASTVVTSNFTVSGPAPASIASADLDDTKTVVTLTLSSPVDAGLGTWTVTALSSSAAAVTDPEGNRLDGTWTGGTSAYVGTFGAVASTADEVTSCAVSRSRFRPDGDDGAGVESDDVDLSFSSASTPEWWVLSVWSAEGELVRREFVSAVASSEVWTWDARDGTERVVDDGIWTIVVDSDDGSGNRGGSCATTVTVDNGTGG
jgi:hypothetical protein